MFKKNKAQELKLQTPMKKFIDDAYGRIGVPILLYFLGVPGFVVLLLWVFFFRGK